MESERHSSHRCGHHEVETKDHGEEEEETNDEFIWPSHVACKDQADEATKVHNASRQIEDAVKILISFLVVGSVVHGWNSFIFGVGIQMTSFNVSVESSRRPVELEEGDNNGDRHGEDGVAVALVERDEQEVRH